jgi:hypothetical protein
MPQYGVLVYSPAPADPTALTPDHVELLDLYPAQAKVAGAKVLGGSYFSGQRGFAFEPTTAAMAISGDTVRGGPLVESDLVVTGFFVLQAPDMETAVRAAELHPAARDGGIEVRPMWVPPAK